MRIGFLTHRWQPERGAPERVMATLAGHLEARGHEVHALGRHGPREEGVPGQFEAVRVPAWTFLSRGARERALGAALLAGATKKELEVTIGVSPLPRVDLYWPLGGGQAETLVENARARAFERGKESPPAEVLVEKAVEAADGRQRTRLDLERRLLEGAGARGVACVSELVRDELAAAYPGAAERLRLIPLGVDLERFHPKERARASAELRALLAPEKPDKKRADAPALPPDAPIVTLVGRNLELKGLPALLAVLTELAERPWRLVVAGARDLKRWRAAARKAGLEERVHLFSHVDPVLLAAGSDLVALPTWRDTTGLVLLEALAAGTPVVTSRRVAGAEMLEDPDAGALIDDPADREALKGALGTWLGRIAEGAVDPEHVRSRVADRDLGRWLAAMEALVVELGQNG